MRKEEKKKSSEAQSLPNQSGLDKNIPKKNSSDENKTFLHFLRLVIIAAIIVFFVLISVAWGTYGDGWQNYFVESVYKVVPYPAASVGYTNWITMNEFNENVKSMRQFLESKEAAFGGGKFDFSTSEGLKRLAIIKKNILNQMIENKIIEIIAHQEGINVSQTELDDTTNKIISRDGKESENTAQLNYLYGWKPEDFKEKVIKYLLYQQKLEDKIKATGELDKNAKEKLAALEKDLADGKDFAELAKTYSDSPSRQYGGLLPAFTREEAPQAFADVAFKLGVGEISQPIEADDGWHFIKLEKNIPAAGSPDGTKPGAEAGQNISKDKVEVSHIFIKRKTLKDWLEEKKKQFKVLVFLKPYYWHDQMSKLYFKDDSLNQSEQEWNREYLNEKSQETDFLINLSQEK